MKMVKSLLLGSAAGVVAVSMGQAADLPVKAKPVEYVKVCSLYGAGFYYMPGTDMCIKIGGWVRVEITDYSGGNMAQGPVQGDANNRNTNNLAMRARGYITADAREQTAYGTARAYIAVGVATTDVGNTILPSALGLNRAFVQWAGITAGEAQSFYDFYSSPATAYRGYMPNSDTGDPGWWLWAYTAQLGNGVTATISAEQRRGTQMCDLTAAAGGAPTNQPGGSAGPCFTNGDLLAAPGSGSSTANSSLLGYGGDIVPDIVGNIRVDQTWGGAQIMAAAHMVNAPYYSTAPISGGPSEAWGYALGAGLRVNFPSIAQGDYLQAQVNYTVGAMRYANMSESAGTLSNQSGATVAYGLATDCVFGAASVAGAQGVATGGTGCNLTTAWGVNVAYEHYWTPQFRESFVGGYYAVKYNTQANAMLCAFEGSGSGNGLAGVNAIANPGCNNNWDIWTGSTRFQYDVTKSLYLGVEFLYQHYDTATSSTGLLGATLAGTTGGSSAFSVLRDENSLSVTARIHKGFLP
jgi:hypothetical protein